MSYLLEGEFTHEDFLGHHGVLKVVKVQRENIMIRQVFCSVGNLNFRNVDNDHEDNCCNKTKESRQVREMILVKLPKYMK